MSWGALRRDIWRYGNKQGDLLNIPKKVKVKLAYKQLHDTKVSCYDLKGRKIKEYKNIRTAARLVGAQTDTIRQAVLGKTITAAKRHWRLGSGPASISLIEVEKKILEGRRKLWKPVTQYDLAGNRLATFKSITEAAKAIGLRYMNISGALRAGVQQTAGNFLWVYGNGDTKIPVRSFIKRKRELQTLYAQPVTQYDLSGKRKFIHSSLQHAASTLKMAPSFLADAATDHQSCQGFYWRMGRGPAMIRELPLKNAEKKRIKKLSKIVIQFDLAGKKIREFPSLAEASRQTNTSAGQISMAARGIYKAAKGSVWKFK